jgi:hypothetical protein
MAKGRVAVEMDTWLAARDKAKAERDAVLAALAEITKAKEHATGDGEADTLDEVRLFVCISASAFRLRMTHICLNSASRIISTAQVGARGQPWGAGRRRGGLL